MIPETVLVLAGAFDQRLDAELVSSAIGRGLTAEGRLECDLCPLEQEPCACTADASGPLDEVDFDRRMRIACALVIACAHLDDRTLVGSVAFEAATRARLGGVPAYAVTAHSGLDRFEARIIDLQMILEAGTPRALAAAGKKLASVV
jgi:hypothetical protein